MATYKTDDGKHDLPETTLEHMIESMRRAHPATMNPNGRCYTCKRGPMIQEPRENVRWLGGYLEHRVCPA